jgi:uncharacterized protein YdeI (YjbR/CyaY-like superfamily)
MAGWGRSRCWRAFEKRGGFITKQTRPNGSSVRERMMGTKDPRVDAYIDKAGDFAKPILKHVRQTIHAECPDIVETIKWGFPHFDYKGGIFCGVAAFKQHCALNFWLGPLLSVDARSEKAMGQFGRITSLSDLPPPRELSQIIKRAMTLHDAGAKVPARAKPATPKVLDVPEALTAALKKNKPAKATFDAFSYTHKKDYAEWIAEAKTETTRDKRIAQAIEWLSEGKTRHWKYQKR